MNIIITKPEDFIRKLIREELNKLKIEPKISRSTGFGLNLVYLSISKSYASAYANGQTSAAHVYRHPIKNGILFYICLDNVDKHLGGDIWISGYKDEIIDDLKQYKDEWNEEDYSEHQLTNLTVEFLNGCGFSKEPNLKEVDILLTYIKKDDLSLISPLEWSAIQEQYGGYSEICLKNIPVENIIKVEIYKNGEIIKTINGKYNNECETIFYHGSPLSFWTHLLSQNLIKNTKFKNMENDELKNESNNANAVLCVVPIDAQKNGTGEEEEYCNWYDCPKCGNGKVMFEDNYCSKCGCKFEWTGNYA